MTPTAFIEQVNKSCTILKQNKVIKQAILDMYSDDSVRDYNIHENTEDIRLIGNEVAELIENTNELAQAVDDLVTAEYEEVKEYVKNPCNNVVFKSTSIELYFDNPLTEGKYYIYIGTMYPIELNVHNHYGTGNTMGMSSQFSTGLFPGTGVTTKGFFVATLTSTGHFVIRLCDMDGDPIDHTIAVIQSMYTPDNIFLEREVTHFRRKEN